jgi:polar amino acid transport system ATP-binding protein
MIELVAVEKWYGGYHALQAVSGRVEPDEVVVVCGPSGSGKSTLIRTINRLEPIQGGTIRVQGHDIHAPQRDINERISCSLEETRRSRRGPASANLRR